jgi:hypothetical protein
MANTAKTSKTLSIIALVVLWTACGGQPSGSEGVPVQPETPGTVTTPTEPSTPSDPTTPSDPDVASDPTTPSTPTTPSQPTTPSEPSTPSQPSAPTGETVVLAIAASAPGTSFTPVTEVSIEESSAVYVVADWKSDVPADAHERLDLRSPDGAAYASLDLSIAAATRGDVTYRVLDDGTRRLAFRLAVWGTQIESLPLTGTWSATVSLVGGSATATAQFELR